MPSAMPTKKNRTVRARGAFLDHCIVATEEASDYVELRDSTVVSTGFEDSLAEFCESLGYKPPKV